MMREQPLPEFESARREQRSFSSGPERNLLIWLAKRIPDRVSSDHITLLGGISMFLTGVCYALAPWSHLGFPLAVVCLALNWLGDSLDGTLARVRKRERPRYGFYVDHMLDSFGAVFLVIGLAVSGYLNERVAAGMLIAFLLLSIETYLATYTLGVFHLSFWKFGPTELRLLLAAATLTLWIKPQASVLGWPLLDFGGSVAIAAMSVAVVTISALHARKLYQEEKLP